MTSSAVEEKEKSLKDEFEKKLQEVQKENETQQQEMLKLELEKDFTESVLEFLDKL